MDHSHDTDAAKSCPMIMMFHAGYCERMLWNSWVADTVVEFVFSCIAWFAIAFIYEALKFLRQYLLKRAAKCASERMAAELRTKSKQTCGNNGSTLNSPLAEIKSRSYLENIFSGSHIVQTLLNMVQVTLSYLLMCIFMTFNYWLCLAVVLGFGLGYFFFGWIKHDANDSDCCF